MRFSVFLTHPLLMIFLLLGFGMSMGELQAQEAEGSMMPVTRTFAFGGKENHPHRDDAPYLANTAADHGFAVVQGGWAADHATGLENAGLFNMAVRQQQASAVTNMQTARNEGNAIRLYMEGPGNTATAVQSQGSGNIMNLGIYGSSNKGDYLQEGSNNYIFDRIGSEKNPVSGVSHKIRQYGSGLSIHKMGMGRMDMQIIQRGFQTQMIIRGSPL